MTVQFSKQGMAATPMPVPVAESRLLRRLLRAQDDLASNASSHG